MTSKAEEVSIIFLKSGKGDIALQTETKEKITKLIKRQFKLDSEKSRYSKVHVTVIPGDDLLPKYLKLYLEHRKIYLYDPVILQIDENFQIIPVNKDPGYKLNKQGG